MLSGRRSRARARARPCRLAHTCAHAPPPSRSLSRARLPHARSLAPAGAPACSLNTSAKLYTPHPRSFIKQEVYEHLRNMASNNRGNSNNNNRR